MRVHKRDEGKIEKRNGRWLECVGDVLGKKTEATLTASLSWSFPFHRIQHKILQLVCWHQSRQALLCHHCSPGCYPPKSNKMDNKVIRRRLAQQANANVHVLP